MLIVQNCQAESPGTILSYFDENQLPHRLVHSYRHESLPEVDEIETLINLGCPHPANDYPRHDFLKRLFDLTVQAVSRGVPYLGICFGGQMLALALGAGVSRNKVREIGVGTVRLTETGSANPLFAGFGPEFPVFQWHADTFGLPTGASLLAVGDNCRNQAFRKGRAVALQFHLEAAPTEIPVWCNVYRQELSEEQLQKKTIVAEYDAIFKTVERLNHRLLDNFFALS